MRDWIANQIRSALLLRFSFCMTEGMKRHCRSSLSSRERAASLIVFPSASSLTTSCWRSVKRFALSLVRGAMGPDF